MSTLISRILWRRRYFEQVPSSSIDSGRTNVELPVSVIDNDDDETNNNNTTTTSTSNNGSDTLTTSVTFTRNGNDTTSIPLAVPVDEEENNNNNNNTEERQTNSSQESQAQSTDGNSPSEEDGDDDDDDGNNIFSSSRRHMQMYESLDELIEERDLFVQRSGAIVNFMSYFLMMMWIQSMLGNPVLLLFTLGITCFFVRYVERAQERINEYNAMVLLWDEGSATRTIRYANHGSSSRDDDNGVGEIAKRKWDKFLYNSRASLIRKENFGGRDRNNSSNKDDDEDEEETQHQQQQKKPSSIEENNKEEDKSEEIEDDDDETNNDPPPTCSICLGEYEKGDELVSLNPCRHVFHEECISEWTKHNTACPLCNVDLSRIV